MTGPATSPVKAAPERALSVCHITTKYMSFEDEVRAYAAAGLNGMSFWWDKLTAYGVTRGARVLRDSGLPAISMVGAPFLVAADPGQAANTFEDLCRALDDCAEVGIPILGVVPGNRYGRSVVAMEDLTVEALLRLAPEARTRGVTLALEAIHEPYFDFLNTLADADRLVRKVDSASVGLLFDAWHLWHEPDLFRRIEETGPRIVLTHFSDWREPTRYHDDRLLPGHGAIPLKSILRKVSASGFQGFYDVEVFSEEIWRGDQFDNLIACRSFFDSIWGDER
ncbi:sugar phosphate isomerase/epimerase family protein [Inquilinus sp. CA228]|uniref:sugar phosphate isomerase/epimerase family protein n=1 Tax=Inquilinus sp. CA228 TaxID=3455609 RepID=UPI003F8D3FC3